MLYVWIFINRGTPFSWFSSSLKQNLFEILREKLRRGFSPRSISDFCKIQIFEKINGLDMWLVTFELQRLDHHINWICSTIFNSFLWCLGYWDYKVSRVLVVGFNKVFVISTCRVQVGRVLFEFLCICSVLVIPSNS